MSRSSVSTLFQGPAGRLAIALVLGFVIVFVVTLALLDSKPEPGRQAPGANAVPAKPSPVLPVNEPMGKASAEGRTESASSLIAQRYDPKLEELKKQAADLEAQHDSAQATARALRREFLKNRPDLQPWEKIWSTCADEFQRQNETPFARTLHDWTYGPPIEIRDKIYKQHEAEVARLRQYLFPQELSSLLDDPETAAFVAPWLQTRLQPPQSADDTLYRGVSGDNLTFVGDVLLPEAAVLRELLASSARKQVAQRYLDQKGLGTVDATMPDGTAEHLRLQLRRVILREAAGRIVQDERPPVIRLHEAKQKQIYERWQKVLRQLRDYQAQSAQ